MKISVRAKTNSKKENVEVKDGLYIVSIKEMPIEGKANEAIIKVLSKHFSVPKNSIVITIGRKGKNKVFDINV